MTAKKKSIYLSILGIGLCVVAYDLISGEDAPASALGAGPPPSAAAVGQSPDSGTQDGLGSLSVAHFPSDFGPSVAVSAVRDISAPTESTMNQLRSPPEVLPTADPDEAEPEAPPEPFSARHSLSAIMVVAGSRCAVVDEKILRKGNSLSDCIVTEIGDRNVQFDCEGTPEGLWLVDPLLGEPSE